MAPRTCENRNARCAPHSPAPPAQSFHSDFVSRLAGCENTVAMPVRQAQLVSTSSPQQGCSWPSSLSFNSKNVLGTEAHTGVCDLAPLGAYFWRPFTRGDFTVSATERTIEISATSTATARKSKRITRSSVWCSLEVWLTGDSWRSSRSLCEPPASTFRGICPSVQRDLFFQSLSAVSLSPNPNNTPEK